jgi:hypothetical protein
VGGGGNSHPDPRRDTFDTYATRPSDTRASGTVDSSISVGSTGGTSRRGSSLSTTTGMEGMSIRDVEGEERKDGEADSSDVEVPSANRQRQRAAGYNIT